MIKSFVKTLVATLTTTIAVTGAAQNWQTVDDYVYTGNVPASAQAVAAGTAGEIYVAGRVGFPTNNHALVRTSKDGGGTWTNIDDFVYSGAVDSQFYAVHVTTGGILFAAGTASQHWFVRRSTDHGASWQTVDDVWIPGKTLYPKSLTSDTNGNLYALGFVDGSTGDFWFLRTSNDGGNTWHTQGSLNLAGVPAQIISVGADLYAAGNQVIDARTYWCLQKSSNGGISWETSDLFIYDPTLPGAPSWAQGIAVDSGGSLYVVGFGQINNGPKSWLVRQAQPGGTGWTTIDDFEPTLSSSAASVAIDAQGNVYVTGGIGGHLITRELSADNGQWNTIDDYSYSTNHATNPFAVAIGPAGSVFVAGYGLAPGVPHWIVRELPPQTLPTLEISIATGLLSVSWPTSATNYVLQTSDILGPVSNWNPFDGIPQVIGDRNFVTLGNTNTARYFRLAK